MNRRSLTWLAAGLVVLVLLAVFGQRQSVPPATDSNALFLPGLSDSLDDVTRIAIASAGGVPAATLERNDSGWSVRERDGYRADLTKIRHTLLSFAEATILEPKTANPEFYDMLGVEDVGAESAQGLLVTLSGSDVDVSVIVGDAAGEYRRYVRRAEDAQSYLISRDPEVGETAADWIDTALIDIQSDRVRTVTVTQADGERVEVAKSDPAQSNFAVANVPDGRELLYESVANVMGSVLQNLALEDVARADASDAPTTVTEYTTFDGLALTVAATQRDDGAWIEITAAASSEAPSDAEHDPVSEAASLNASLGGWRFRIPSYKFDQLTRRMDDLLKAAP